MDFPEFLFLVRRLTDTNFAKINEVTKRQEKRKQQRETAQAAAEAAARARAPVASGVSRWTAAAAERQW